MTRNILLYLALGLSFAGCVPRTEIITAQCPPPPEIVPYRANMIDTTLPVNEQVRQIVIGYGECLRYVDQCTEALDAYRKDQ
jgi:hypothetical protein